MTGDSDVVRDALQKISWQNSPLWHHDESDYMQFTKFGVVTPKFKRFIAIQLQHQSERKQNASVSRK